MRRSRSAFVLGLVGPVLALALVAGCSEDPEPKFAPTSPTATPSESASSSPTGPVEPTMPAAAKKHTAAGAKAFVGYWVDEVNYAQMTGDTTELSNLMDRRCETCRGLMQAIVEPYGNGGRIKGGDWRLGRVRELPADFGAEWGGYAQGHVTKQMVIAGDGTRKKYPGGSFRFFGYLDFNDGWRMRWLRTPS